MKICLNSNKCIIYHAYILDALEGDSRNIYNESYNMKKKPEIPRSYPKMSPLDAATMQVMTTESVILLSTSTSGASALNPPPAMLNLL